MAGKTISISPRQTVTARSATFCLTCSYINVLRASAPDAHAEIEEYDLGLAQKIETGQGFF